MIKAAKISPLASLVLVATVNALISGCGISTSPNGSLTLNAAPPPGSGINGNAQAVRPGGYAVEKPREVGEFHNIENHARCELNVTIGRPCSILIQAEENYIPQVITRVEGGTLIIEIDKHSPETNAPVRLIVTMPKLDKLDNSGVGSVKIDNLSQSYVNLQESGVGSLTASGTADMVDLNLSGVASADLNTLHAKSVTAVLSGTGSAKVFAIQSLTATVSGIGKLTYGGNPPKVQKTVTGLGAINPQ